MSRAHAAIRYLPGALDPVAIDEENGAIAQFHYLGHRVVQRTLGNDTIMNQSFSDMTRIHAFAHDGWQEIEERDEEDMVQKQYIFGNYIDEPIIMDRFVDEPESLGSEPTTMERYFYHQNTPFSTMALTDGDGYRVESYLYEAYGKATVLDLYGETISYTSTVENTLLFTARRLDTGKIINLCALHESSIDSGLFLVEKVVAQPIESNCQRITVQGWVSSPDVKYTREFKTRAGLNTTSKAKVTLEALEFGRKVSGHLEVEAIWGAEVTSPGGFISYSVAFDLCPQGATGYVIKDKKTGSSSLGPQNYRKIRDGDPGLFGIHYYYELYWWNLTVEESK